MIDTIKPMGMDLTKNLHGHVRVELRDRWTGRVVDSREKDNLVTDAVAKMVLTTAWSSQGMAAVWTPLYQKLLGGVLLFDNTLTESASNIKFPSSAKLVAYAGQDSNSSEAIGGSLNAEESVAISNGFTTVWDFLTSQANGTIASLARTSYAFNSFPVLASANSMDLCLGMTYPTGMDHAALTYLGYDETNKYIYLAPINTITVLDVSYPHTNIYRAKFDVAKIHLDNAIPAPAKWELVKTLTSADGTNYARNFLYDPYANNFAYYSNRTLHLVAMDGTHTTKTLAGGPYNSDLAVTENYYWTRSASGDAVYWYDKTNTASAQSVSVVNNYIAPGDNDTIFAFDTSSTKILYADGTVINKAKIGTASLLGYNLRQIGPMYAWGNGAGSSTTAYMLYPNAHYLGTIANLDNPVTKTSSQTMKITYTLTEA